MNPIKSLSPGIIVVSIISILAICISKIYGAPVMLIALLIGISGGFLHRNTQCKAGIEFIASTVLRFGVALIGLRIAFSDVIALGWQNSLLLFLAVISTIIFGIFLSRVFGLSKNFGLISGGATGICGASAALAISSVLPDSKEKEQDTLLTIIGVTVLSTIAMISYPLISMYLGFNTTQTSMFLGGSIHDVAQVVGAGYSISPEIGDMAVLTKLMRISLLVPIVLAILFTISYNSKSKKNNTATIFPLFLIVFIILMIINSIITLPNIITENSAMISKYTLIAAICAIGMKTDLKKLLTVGYKPFLILSLEALWIAGIFLAYFIF